eukprot:105697-Rhodomonas_salina.1
MRRLIADIAWHTRKLIADLTLFSSSIALRLLAGVERWCRTCQRGRQMVRSAEKGRQRGEGREEGR